MSMFCHRSGAAFAAAIFVAFAAAPVEAEPQFTAPGAARPKVGLVLAGGGAKGGAHVGVLKVSRSCTCRSIASPAPAWEP